MFLSAFAVREDIQSRDEKNTKEEEELDYPGCISASSNVTFSIPGAWY